MGIDKDNRLGFTPEVGELVLSRLLIMILLLPLQRNDVSFTLTELQIN